MGARAGGYARSVAPVGCEQVPLAGLSGGVDVSVLPLFGDVPTTRKAMEELAKSLRRRGWREYNREQLDLFCDAVGCPMLVVC